MCRNKKKKKRLQKKREERADREEVRDGRLLLLLLGRRSDLLESREGLQWRRDALYKRVTKSAVFCLFFLFFFLGGGGASSVILDTSLYLVCVSVSRILTFAHKRHTFCFFRLCNTSSLEFAELLSSPDFAS